MWQEWSLHRARWTAVWALPSQILCGTAPSPMPHVPSPPPLFHPAQILERVNTVSGKVYREDPTIMAFDLLNEPRCSVSYVSGREREGCLHVQEGAEASVQWMSATRTHPSATQCLASDASVHGLSPLAAPSTYPGADPGLHQAGGAVGVRDGDPPQVPGSKPPCHHRGGRCVWEAR